MNKISNQSYFVKRLKDCGYYIYKIFDKYSEADCRCWTIMIDPGGTSTYCTYVENKEEEGNNYFELYDNSQYILGKIKIATNSIEVFITYLVRFGINKKFEQQSKR